MFNNSVTLSNGVVVPQLALGTWLIDDDKVGAAVKAAIGIGYRHIDTAQAYANERGVGEGIKASGLRRDEIFVTTKVAAEHKDYKSASEGIDGSLKDMEILKHLDKIENYGDSSFFPVYGGKLKGYSGKPGTEEV
jgi:diketogulonate reductase-like aldo/keto reductase